MNRRQKIIVSVTGIFIVLLILVGLTYAYFLTQITGNTNDKSISVTTADLKLVYGDGNGVLEAANAIEPGDSINFKTTSGDTVDAKEFTVKNEGNITTSYVVVIEDVNVTWTTAGTTSDEEGNTVTYNAGDATSFKTNDFVYTLTCTSDVANSECNGIEKEVTFPINGGYLVLNNIKEDETQTYSLKMKYLETGIDQSADMNKTFTAKVDIENVVENNPYRGKTDTLAYTIINNAENVTAEEKALGYAELVATPPTSVANEVSGADESVLSVAQDDFGVSYYYRGNVQNNYVNFAGMCWKAVRIDGSGNTKLILEDQYAECNDNEDTDGEGTEDYQYTGNWSIGEGTYGYKTKIVNQEVTNEETGETTTETIINFKDADFYDDIRTATIRRYLLNFQDDEGSKLNGYHDKLVSGNWCSGDSVYETIENEDGTVIGYNLLDMTTDADDNGVLDSLEEKYKTQTTFSYGSHTRLLYLNINQNGGPTFKCDSTSFEYLDSDKIIPMYVGAITADEVAFAGGVWYGNGTSNHYLVSTQAYQGLSLLQYRENAVWNVAVLNNGTITRNKVDNSNYKKIRPMITLKSANTITGGIGTISDPYVIG